VVYYQGPAYSKAAKVNILERDSFAPDSAKARSGRKATEPGGAEKEVRGK